MVEKHLILALLWVLFCLLHSLLAALGLKKRLAIRMGQRYKYYRLFYTLFAFVTLGIVVVYAISFESYYLYNRTLLSTLIGAVTAVFGLVVMAICIKKYFLSLSGLKSLFQESPTNTLMLTGIHQFVRHPLYAGTFLAIWGVFIAYPLLSIFISNVIITVYTLVGIELEEKKLEAEFGPDYKQYKQKVPKLFPALRFKEETYRSTPK